MKKRVLVLLGRLGVGGAEHMVHELIKNMGGEEFDVQVICTLAKENTVLEDRVEQLCPVTYLGETDAIGVGALRRVMKAISAAKPDIIHAHMGGAGFASPWAVLHRKPLVITVHTKPEKAFTKKIEMLVKMALRFGKTRLVAVSEDNAEKVRAYFKLGAKKSGCVNNGVDLGRFYRTPHEGFCLINVARHDKNKNQAALIRCFSRLHAQYPQTKLLLLGNGETHKELIEQVQALELSHAVTFTGNVPDTETYYAQSDLYVQSSHREAMPLSVLEAMAAGLPIVSTDVGGLRDVVRENGILVPDGDEDALYEAILQVYKQETEKTEAMCAASHELVKAYSSESMARAYKKIYREML